MSEKTHFDLECFKSVIGRLIGDLARKDYQKIMASGENGRIPIPNLVERINEYGEDIVPLPDYGFSEALCYNIANKYLDVYIPIWTVSGKSDLTLSLKCWYEGGRPIVAIEDLEVL